MDDATRCPHCNARMKAVLADDGRTDLRCLECDRLEPIQIDDVKWVDHHSAPTKAA